VGFHWRGHPEYGPIRYPGGNDVNLANQLKEQNAWAGFKEVSRRFPVSCDLGFPPGTPTSQIVGTQRCFNHVLAGERYKDHSPTSELYLQGRYVKHPAK